MATVGGTIDLVPQPLNLVMNIPIHSDGTQIQGTPPASPGDDVALRAERGRTRPNAIVSSHFPPARRT
jgi:uncharacterized protein YcgI (DUF1989 family)